MGLIKGVLQGEVQDVHLDREDRLLITIEVPHQHIHDGENVFDWHKKWVGIVPQETVDAMEEEQGRTDGTCGEPHHA